MFSVVIPLYNKELSIQNTIHSVLNQTVQDFEIVIVNDGSTDNSVEKVVEIFDARIRIINKPNGGVSSARNMGVEEAKYEWIAFLDGDDLWKVNHLEEIVKMMKLFPNEQIYCTSFVCDNQVSKSKSLKDDIIVLNTKEYFKLAYFGAVIWTSILVVNKRLFSENNGFNENLSRGEDLELWSRLANKTNVVKNSKVTAVYRLEAENRSFSNKLNFNKSYISIISLNTNTKEERKYNKMLLKAAIKKNIKSKDLFLALKLILKYFFK